MNLLTPPDRVEKALSITTLLPQNPGNLGVPTIRQLGLDLPRHRQDIPIYTRIRQAGIIRYHNRQCTLPPTRLVSNRIYRVLRKQ